MRCRPTELECLFVVLACLLLAVLVVRRREYARSTVVRTARVGVDASSIVTVLGAGRAKVRISPELRVDQREAMPDRVLQWACRTREGFAVADGGGRNAIDLYDRQWRQRRSVAIPDGFNGPVGVVDASDGNTWVACFGWPSSTNACLLKMAPDSRTTTYALPDDLPSHVHNVYEFALGGRSELFVAAIGKIFEFDRSEDGLPDLNAGFGLVRFDRVSGKFDVTNPLRRHIRGAQQLSNGQVVAVTQEDQASHAPTRVLLLSWGGGSQWTIDRETTLPARSGGDGGADVITLPGERLAVSDRCAPNESGRVYILEQDTLEVVQRYKVGYHPRFMRHLPEHDVILTCDKDDASDDHASAGLSVIRLDTGRVSSVPMPALNPSFVL